MESCLFASKHRGGTLSCNETWPTVPHVSHAMFWRCTSHDAFNVAVAAPLAASCGCFEQVFIPMADCVSKRPAAGSCIVCEPQLRLQGSAVEAARAATQCHPDKPCDTSACCVVPCPAARPVYVHRAVKGEVGACSDCASLTQIAYTHHTAACDKRLLGTSNAALSKLCVDPCHVQGCPLRQGQCVPQQGLLCCVSKRIMRAL